MSPLAVSRERENQHFLRGVENYTGARNRGELLRAASKNRNTLGNWRRMARSRNFGRPRFLPIPNGEPGISAVEGGEKRAAREKGKAPRLMQITTELQAGLHHCSHFIFRRAKGFSVTNVPRFAPLFSRFSLFAAAAAARPLRNM